MFVFHHRASFPGIRMLMVVSVLIGGFAAPSRADIITVYAASSLTESSLALFSEYTRISGNEIKYSFAASSVLARQIINGAPADIYISANKLWMDEIERDDLLILQSRRIIATNRIALVAYEPSGWRTPPNGIIDKQYPLIDVLGGQYVAIADPNHVPAGIYTRQSLQKSGLWAALRGQFVGTANVRAALAMVERGETPFGFVYASDIRYSDSISMVGLLPLNSHDPIIYTAAALDNGHTRSVQSFMEFLSSDSARSILKNHGLLAPPAQQSQAN